MPHFISGYLFGGDPQIRRVGGVAALMPNVVWPGAQIMGVAYVLELVFSIDYRIAVLVCGVIFVFYTVSGGMKAVVYADAFPRDDSANFRRRRHHFWVEVVQL